MTLYVALGLALAAAAVVAWPLVRGRRPPAEPEATPADAFDRLDAELRLDAAAGRIPLAELDELRERVRESLRF